MIILNKKRLIFIFSSLIISVLTVSIFYNKQSENIETVALPVSNKVVVLDAGHGRPDEGELLLKLWIQTLQYQGIRKQ